MKRYALYDVATSTKRRPHMQMVKAPDGGWVRYEDVEKALKELADAKSALRYIETTHGRVYGVGWDRLDLTTPQGAKDEG